jgi:two-component system cell cycle sensor histidine kinase/response regulator CckA
MEFQLSQRVLLVEDEWVIRALVVEWLADEGMAVAEAQDGAEALRIVSEGLLFGLLIIDLNLGRGPSGRDVTRCIRERYPNLPVVFASAYPPEPTDFQPPLSIRAFLRKPYGHKDMLDVVSSLALL